IEYLERDDLIRQADYLSLHVALTAETTHLISNRELDLMKPTAYLINTTRGPVVDEKALVDALREGKIGGAGLDVFENEPQVETGLLGLENVVLTPHLGSATIGTRTRMGMMVADNIEAFIKGLPYPNLVNTDVLRGTTETGLPP
ncbi:MAG: D-glycerate dehydrogenase, partial [Opitutae bacterium]|nr:D-glycerate dehydrogenase [Opitutae bacterium]